MNVEELVQDIILSLTGEVPPIKKVAEILVKAFPNPEVVRVPLRDKYSAVQRRLQDCIVKGPSSEEMMSFVLHAARKVNVKTLKCVMRNIGPYEKNIWEPPEEEAHDPGACCYDKLSLGTSLSRSTISDLGSSQICSDAETGESLSEALLAEEANKHLLSQMQENRREHELNSFLFDVHTTLKRRQIQSSGTNMFRAGSCYATVFEPSASELALLRDERKRESKERTLPVNVQQEIEPSNHESVMRFPARRGLFGLSRQSSYSTHCSDKNRTHTPVLTRRWSEQVSSTPQKVPIPKCIYKVIQTTDAIQREETTPEMKFKFNNVAHLLEWMIRWSDKRLLSDPTSRQPFQECQPTMHVKLSASAILASLWLLEYYSNKSEDQNASIPKLQRPSASICSSTLRSKTEKDSTLDADCSPSAETSIAIPDSHAYGKPSEDAPGTLQEKQSEKRETDFKGQSVTHDMVIGGTDWDVVLLEEVGEFTPSKVEVTAENEDYCEDAFAVSRSPTISVSVKSVQQRKEHQSLSDVQYPQKDVFVKTLEGNFSKLESITCETIPSNVPCSSCPEMKAESTSSEMAVSENQPSFTAVSSALSNNSSGPKHEVIGAREPISQPTAPPLNTSDAVREMLQDEMFKLVQLQQINFMSLMQVVGASFANWPNVSLQTTQPRRPFQSERSQTPNLAGIDAKRSSPRHPADGLLKAQMANENSCPASMQNIHPQEGDDFRDQQSHNGYVLKPPHTNDSSNLPESHSDGKRQNPSFQGLLPPMPAGPLPLLFADLKDEKKPKLIPLAKPLNNAGGLPLLQLKPQDELQPFRIGPATPPKSLLGTQPQRKECWAAPAPWVENPQGGPTGPLNLKSYDQKAVRQAQEQARNQAESLSKETCKQPHLDKYGKTEDVSFHHFHAHLRAEKSLADNETLLQKTYEHFTPFPLLYLKPWSQSKRPSTSVTVKCAGKEQQSSECCGQTALPLLYAKLSPLIKFQTPKLIPLQNLIEFEQSRRIAQYEFHKGHQGRSEQIQLLKADINSQEARQERNNKKRQKRRVQRQIREKKETEKTTVNCEQEDSVGLADTVKETKDNQVKFSGDFSDGGSLLNRDGINVAELHYLASVRKRAVELQDACTNTDTVLTLHQDMQTLSEEIIHEPGTNHPICSASASVPDPESHQDMQDRSEEIHSEINKNKPTTSPSACHQDLYMRLTFPTEAAEKPLPPSLSDAAPDLIGQKYISVVDIENDGELNNLPDISESLPKSVSMQAVKTGLPTPAKLHHMAASVTNLIPPEEFEEKEHYSIHEIMENSAEAAALESESFPASYVDLRTSSVSPSVSAATLRIKKSSSDVNFKREELDESFSDRLQMTGLSGVSDIITDLIAEGGISTSELGLTETQTKKSFSLSSVASKYSHKTKRDRKELQSWMKRKRKERLAEYMQTLAERRAKEHRPFPGRKNTYVALSTRDIKMQQKRKDEKDKALFSEHHSRRVSEALVMMHELLSDTVQLPSNDYKQIPKITSPRDFKRPCIASSERYHGCHQTSRRMASAQAGFSESKSFSTLSSDVIQRRASRQTRKLVNQRRLPTAETATQASEESDGGAMSSWSIPDEIQQILYGSSDFNKETLTQEEDCCIANLNNFDSVSESTSSILSKLDWKAVEAMVADVEEK
ncbi:hypothetical protein JRQ81_012987 [Phrynocephalus forsythii]|uniref:Uncharacterized protein n=1 Tax=Phrynocephalus forsythii TaxID=171643 RepID=A0A9Q0XZA9_9SAUR|nr:hypothetical protein JRQ81_012987 [Phrynocephalus forsythii]